MEYPINNKAIYRTWILVVLWVFQMIVEVINIGVNGLRVSVLAFVVSVTKNNDSQISSGNCVVNLYVDKDGNQYTSTTCDGTTYNSKYLNLGLGAACFALAFAIIFFITHIVQIVQYGRKRLTPKANFGYDLFRFLFTTIMLILNIASAAVFGTYILTIIFVILVWLLYLMGVIYASILFHRFRKGAYDNLLPVSNSNQAAASQTVYPNKQEANYSSGQYQQPYQSAPGVVPNPPSFRH